MTCSSDKRPFPNRQYVWSMTEKKRKRGPSFFSFFAFIHITLATSHNSVLGACLPLPSHPQCSPFTYFLVDGMVLLPLSRPRLCVWSWCSLRGAPSSLLRLPCCSSGSPAGQPVCGGTWALEGWVPPRCHQRLAACSHSGPTYRSHQCLGRDSGRCVCRFFLVLFWVFFGRERGGGRGGEGRMDGGDWVFIGW